MAKPPLHGIRVIELARILAGPWAGQLLADLGADVIKVESPKAATIRAHGGRPSSPARTARTCRPPITTPAIAASARSPSTSRRRTAPKPCASCRRIRDVLIENFKLGGLTKYGLDYESLRKINPRLVYCSITGFGQTGPYASRAGYDFIVQGMSGLMSITGQPDGEPQKVGVAVADIFTGLYSVDRHPGGTAPCRGDRPGPACRHGAVRLADLRARQPEPELSGLRQGAAPDGQRPPQHRALRGVAGRRTATSSWRSAMTASSANSAP